MRAAAVPLGLCLFFGCTETSMPDKPAPVKAAQPAAAREDPPPAKEEPPAQKLDRFSFDKDAPDSVPAGWTITETGPAGTPATWAVAADDTAPSGPNVFGVLETNNGKETYNVALAPFPPARDVDLSVMVKPVTGKLDQGGGFVLRAKEATDYYIVRWNPLEKNVKFYKVVASHRDQIAVAETDLDTSQWHSLRVLAEGSRFEIFVDDETVLKLEDTTHNGAGQVGLWTKADAATLFDDFVASAL